VPCYDLVLVIELTLGPHKAELRVLPTPLTWRADFTFWNIVNPHVASGFPALRESNSFQIHFRFKFSNLWNSRFCKMCFAFNKLSYFTKNIEIHIFRVTL